MNTSKLFKGQKIDIPCPNCGHKKNVEASWLLQQGSTVKLTCRGCSKEFDANTTKLKASIEKAVKDFKKLFK